MSSFDYGNLKKLQDALSKQAFVPIDSKSAQAAPPDAGGMPPPDAGGMPPMDPAAMGMDPAAMGGGMPPMDPSMMGGGMPPPGGAPMDPMMGMPPPEQEMSPDGEPYIKMTMSQLIKLVEQIAKLSTKITSPGGAAPAQSNAAVAGSGGADPERLAAIDAKTDAIINGMG